MILPHGFGATSRGEAIAARGSRRTRGRPGRFGGRTPTAHEATGKDGGRAHGPADAREKLGEERDALGDLRDALGDQRDSIGDTRDEAANRRDKDADEPGDRRGRFSR
jgi:hypothetical protein